MRYHAAFCAILSAVVVDYDSEDPSSRFHLDRAEKMAKQFLHQRKLFTELLQHSGSYQFLNERRVRVLRSKFFSSVPKKRCQIKILFCRRYPSQIC